MISEGRAHEAPASCWAKAVMCQGCQRHEAAWQQTNSPADISAQDSPVTSFTGTEPMASLMEVTNLQAWLSEGLQDSTIVHCCSSKIYSVSISPFRAFSGPCEEAGPKTRTALSSRAFCPVHFSSSQTGPKPLSLFGSRQK